MKTPHAIPHSQLWIRNPFDCLLVKVARGSVSVRCGETTKRILNSTTNLRTSGRLLPVLVISGIEFCSLLSFKLQRKKNGEAFIGNPLPQSSTSHPTVKTLATLTFQKFAVSFCGKHQGWGKNQIVCIWKDWFTLQQVGKSPWENHHHYHLLGPGWHHRIIATTHLCLDISQHSVPNQLRGGSVSAAWGWKKQPKYVYISVFVVEFTLPPLKGNWNYQLSNRTIFYLPENSSYLKLYK